MCYLLLNPDRSKHVFPSSHFFTFFFHYHKLFFLVFFCSKLLFCPTNPDLSNYYYFGQFATFFHEYLILSSHFFTISFLTQFSDFFFYLLVILMVQDVKPPTNTDLCYWLLPTVHHAHIFSRILNPEPRIFLV